MSIKDELLKLRTKLAKDIKEENELIDLDDKVDVFIDWYRKNIVNEIYSSIGKYRKPREMRNLIEKMAVWYELKYPSYEINRLMPGSSQEEININDLMFKKNSYINDSFDEDSDIRKLEWDKLNNASAFIKSLPWEERNNFDKPIYKDIVWFDPELGSAHLHLTKDGVVEMAEEVSTWTDGIIKDEELKGLYAEEVVKLFKEKGIKLPEGNELEKNIERVNNAIYQKEEMLNCVMYRIIERGGIRFGPRRAFLFAKDFGRDISIPMQYAVDYSDSGLRSFINEYIKSGGSEDLECYIGYFHRTDKNEKLNTISVQDLILTQNVVNQEEFKKLKLKREIERKKQIENN